MQPKLEWLYDSRSWFAWRPVKTTSGRWVWLRWVTLRDTTSFRMGNGGENNVFREYIDDVSN